MSKKLSLILIILFLALSGCGRKKAAPAVSRAIPVKVTTVTVGDIKEVFSTNGSVEAKNKANISAKIAGRVTQVLVQLGDYVSKGQVLATLEQTDLLNQLNQSQAIAAQAQAGYQQNKDNFLRKQKLFADQIISAQEFDAAKAQFEIAESQLRQSRAGIDMIKEQLKNTEIKAPLNGYIGSRGVNLGEMVSPGVPLFSIVDLSQVYITVDLSDSYITQVKPKQPAEISPASAPDRTYYGGIAQIAPMADPVTKTYPVKILLNNSARVFKDGMLVQVKLDFNHQKGTLLLPLEAIVEETGGKVVFAVENKTAIRKPVEVGISDGKSVAITAGLKAGEQIVVMGQNNLEDGLKVVVK